MERNIGYWLSDTDVIPVMSDHADPVLAEPERFGLTRDAVIEVYRRHDESPGQEGHARDEVIRRAAEQGWIRVRIHDLNGGRVIVQGHNPTERMERIASFLADLVNRDIIACDETVVLSDFVDNSSTTLDWSDGGVATVINNGGVDL
ncbi:MAG: hypothetical protein ACOCYG_04760 [Spirochaetota bacterium]